MSEQEIKSYAGGKSKAIRGLRAYGAHAEAASEKLLFQYGDKSQWSFYVEDAVKAQTDGEAAAGNPTPIASDEVPQEDAHLLQGNVVSEQELIKQYEASGEFKLEHQEEDSSAPAPSVFAGINQTLSNVPPAPPAVQPSQRAESRNKYKIEKNRPEQNGIKRPSEGGLCRAVWDAMDDLRTENNGAIPTSEQVRAVALARGWNKNNAMIEFYQWRKYNGIVGRTPKAAPAPEPVVLAKSEATSSDKPSEDVNLTPLQSHNGEAHA